MADPSVLTQAPSPFLCRYSPVPALPVVFMSALGRVIFSRYRVTPFFCGLLKGLLGFGEHGGGGREERISKSQQQKQNNNGCNQKPKQTKSQNQNNQMRKGRREGTKGRKKKGERKHSKNFKRRKKKERKEREIRPRIKQGSTGPGVRVVRRTPGLQKGPVISVKMCGARGSHRNLDSWPVGQGQASSSH